MAIFITFISVYEIKVNPLTILKSSYKTDIYLYNTFSSPGPHITSYVPFASYAHEQGTLYPSPA